MDNGGNFVTYDFECPCGTQERTVRRRELGDQKCHKGHKLAHVLTGCGKQDIMRGYPYVHPTLPHDHNGNEPVVNSPRHFSKLLRDNGLVVAGGSKKGWS